MKQIFCEKLPTFTLIGKVSPDRMKVFVEGHPNPGDHKFTAQEINDVIWKYVPQRLVHDRVVEEIAVLFNKGEAVSERRVSKGQEPENGQDGKLVVMVKAFTLKPELTEDQRGFTNLNELHLFDNLVVNQVVARIYPPQNGKDGADAFGKPIASKPGKPFKPSFDKKTLALKADKGYETLSALVAGYLQIEGGSLSVAEDLVVSGNVDFHVGNINFVGSVTVRGDVMPGFTVQAQKAILVTGSVHKGTLLCQGPIECKGNVTGGDNARVVTSSNLRATVLNEILVEAGGDLEITKEIRDSKLYVGGVVLGDAAAILGGELRTAQGVQVRQLGFESGKLTTISLCSTIESRREFAQLLEQIEKHEHALHLLELHLGPLAKNPDRVQLLKGEHRTKIEKLLEKLSSVSKSLDSLRGKKVTLINSASKIEGLRVNVQQKAHAGLKVVAGEHEIILKEEVAGPQSLVYESATGEFKWDKLVPLTVKSDDKKKEKPNAGKK